MKQAALVLTFVLAAGSALAQTTPNTAPPGGAGGGNPPTGWSGGAQQPSSDTGKTHPDGMPPSASPAPATPAPPIAGDVVVTNESQARARLEAEGFTDVGGLKKDADGMWRGHATRGTSKVTVSVDGRGNFSAE